MSLISRDDLGPYLQRAKPTLSKEWLRRRAAGRYHTVRELSFLLGRAVPSIQKDIRDGVLKAKVVTGRALLVPNHNVAPYREHLRAKGLQLNAGSMTLDVPQETNRQLF